MEHEEASVLATSPEWAGGVVSLLMWATVTALALGWM
jgi:hypothetical protein